MDQSGLGDQGGRCGGFVTKVHMVESYIDKG